MNTLSISFAGHDQSRRFNDHHRTDCSWKRRSHTGNHLQKNENEQVSQTFIILPFANFTILPFANFTILPLDKFYHITILPLYKSTNFPLDRLPAFPMYQASKKIKKHYF